MQGLSRGDEVDRAARLQATLLVLVGPALLAGGALGSSWAFPRSTLALTVLALALLASCPVALVSHFLWSYRRDLAEWLGGVAVLRGDAALQLFGASFIARSAYLVGCVFTGCSLLAAATMALGLLSIYDARFWGGPGPVLAAWGLVLSGGGFWAGIKICAGAAPRLAATHRVPIVAAHAHVVSLSAGDRATASQGAVAGTAAAPAIELLEGEAAPLGEASCPICAEPLDGDVVRCPRCETPHHRDCWQYNGGCSTYGCRTPPA